MGIHKPDVNIFLHVPAEIGHKLVLKKAQRGYLKGKKRDIYEDSMDLLKQAEKIYLEMVKTFPHDFEKIECAPRAKLLSIEKIHGMILERLSPL